MNGLRRKLTSHGCSAAENLWCVLWPAGWMVFLLIVQMDNRKSYISENNLKPRPDLLPRSAFLGRLPLATQKLLGRRATSSLQLIFLLDYTQSCSVEVVERLLYRWAQLPNLAAAITVYPLQQATQYYLPTLVNRSLPLTAAMLVKFSSCTFDGVHITGFGAEGTMPNLDLLNIAAFAALESGLEVSTLRLLKSRALGSFLHFIAAINDSLSRDSGSAVIGTLRSLGVHTVVWEEGLSEDNGENERKDLRKNFHLLLQSMDLFVRQVSQLEEKLHHSFPIWFSTGATTFIDFEALQLSIFCYIGAMLSLAYRSRAKVLLRGVTPLFLMAALFEKVNHKSSYESKLLKGAIASCVALATRRHYWIHLWCSVEVATDLALNPPASMLTGALCSTVLVLHELFPKFSALMGSVLVAVTCWGVDGYISEVSSVVFPCVFWCWGSY